MNKNEGNCCNSPRSNEEARANSHSQLMPVTGLSDGDVPRQPKNLQGLLKLSTSLQTEQTSTQMDPTSAQFLNEALSGLTVDLGTELQSKLLLLEQLTKEPTQDEDVVEVEDEDPLYELFEEIIDLVENIDMANVLYQIGGLATLSRLLRHRYQRVRALAAKAIATCCRNNPKCQLQSSHPPIIVTLVKIVDLDSHLDTKCFAVSALSAIVRNNPQSIKLLRQSYNLVFLKKAMESGNEKLMIRTTYLISALCDTDNSVKDELVEMGIVEKLMSLVKLTSGLIVEHFLRALESLTRDHAPARHQCLDLRFCLFLRVLSTKSEEDNAYKEIKELATLLMAYLGEEAAKDIPAPGTPFVPPTRNKK